MFTLLPKYQGHLCPKNVCNCNPSVVMCHEIGHLRIAFSSVSKRVLVHSLLHGNVSCLHVCCLTNQAQCHERLFTKTRSETEVKIYSEVAYCYFFPKLKSKPKRTPTKLLKTFFKRLQKHF